jgi:hypothetical protein
VTGAVVWYAFGWPQRFACTSLELPTSADHRFTCAFFCTSEKYGRRCIQCHHMCKSLCGMCVMCRVKADNPTFDCPVGSTDTSLLSASRPPLFLPCPHRLLSTPRHLSHRVLVLSTGVSVIMCITTTFISMCRIVCVCVCVRVVVPLG